MERVVASVLSPCQGIALFLFLSVRVCVNAAIHPLQVAGLPAQQVLLPISDSQVVQGAGEVVNFCPSDLPFLPALCVSLMAHDTQTMRQPLPRMLAHTRHL